MMNVVKASAQVRASDGQQGSTLQWTTQWIHLKSHSTLHIYHIYTIYIHIMHFTLQALPRIHIHADVCQPSAYLSNRPANPRLKALFKFRLCHLEHLNKTN